MRCPDPSCNPYLAFAVMLAAGLDGIRRELPVPEATEEDLYALDTERRAKLNCCRLHWKTRWMNWKRMK